MYTVLNNKVVKIISFVEVSSIDVEDNIKSVKENIEKLNKSGKKADNELARLGKYEETLAVIKEQEALLK